MELECRSVLPGETFDFRSPEVLARLDYETELRLKSAALQRFLPKRLRVLRPIEPSPKNRHYRTTTKRRGHFDGRKFEFRMANGAAGKSLLEPEAHSRIYECVEAELNLPRSRPLAQNLNYLILRGDYETFAVIWNMRQLSGEIVRRLKAFDERLRQTFPDIASACVYLDESGSDYYLERERPEDGKVALKKLFGSSLLSLRVDNVRLLYDATVFSQVNLSLLPRFCVSVLGALQMTSNTRLIDLYCGYGLFSLLGAATAQSVVGVDYAGEAIHNAVAGAKHLYPGKNLRYYGCAITPESLRKTLPPPAADEVVILDPPRAGTVPGVIETLCSRRPRRVAHVFCGIDVLPKELSIWENNGYEVETLAPFDLFPGTANLETVAVLRRKN